MLMLAGVATCADSPTAATAKHLQRMQLALAPQFAIEPGAPNPAATVAAAGLVMDSARVLVVREPSDTLADTTVAFALNQADLSLDIDIAATPGEKLDVVMQYRAGSVLLFEGTGKVDAREPNTPPVASVPVVLSFVGPGKNAAALSISPSGGTYTSTTPVQFSFGVVDSAGTSLTNVPIFWVSSDTSVAKIGVFTGLMQFTGKRGSSTISVKMMGRADLGGDAVMTFVPPPTSMTLVSGGGQKGTVAQALSQPIVFELKSADGGAAAAQQVTFSVNHGSVSPAIATTDANGRAQTSVTLDTLAGPLTVTAVDGTLNATASDTAVAAAPASIVTVSGSGQVDTVSRTLANPFVAKVADHWGNLVNGATVTWTRVYGGGSFSSPTSTTNASGLAQVGYTLGTAPGKDSISATVTGVTAGAQFVVTAVPSGPSSVTISPTSLGFSTLGRTSTLTAVAKDQNGNALPNATITWASRASSVATVSSSGVVTAVANGTARIVATSGSAADSIVVTVQQTAASLLVSPTAVALYSIGRTAAVTVAAKDSLGNAISAPSVTWTSRAPSVATVSTTGVVTAVANGTARIVATSGTGADSMTVTVQQYVAGVVISPHSATISTLGHTKTLTASATDSTGHAVSGATYTWVSRTPSVATVSSTGVVTAVANGTARVVATSGTGKDSITVTVQQTIASIVLAPRSETFNAFGQTAAVSATAKDSAGNAITNPAITWTSRTTSVASVSGAGVVQAIGNGSSWIVAKGGTGADSISATVRQVVASVTMTRDTVYLPSLLDTATTVGVLRDSNSNLITDLVPTYTSADTIVARISASGLITLDSIANTDVYATFGNLVDTTHVVGGVAVRAVIGSIRVNTPNASPRVGDTLQLSADSTGASGIWSPITPGAWASDQPGRASVNSSGIVIANDTGAVAISATLNAMVGHQPLTVLPAPMLTGFRYSPSVLNGITSNPLTMSFQVNGYDKGVGIVSVQITLTAPDNTTQTCTVSTLTTGSVNNGVWDCALTLPAGSPAGTWHITQVLLHGTIDRAFAESALSAFGATTVTVNP